MGVSAAINVAILLLLWGAQVNLRSFLSKKIHLITTTAILASSVPLLANSYLLYGVWLNSPLPARYFLPPYTDISYYIFTIGRRFWIAYLIGIIIALVFLLLISIMKKERRDMIFEKEEPYIIVSSIALTGHPSWIAYLIISLFLYLLLSLLSKGKRVSMYYYWLPLSVLTIILTPLTSNFNFLSILRLSV